MSEKKWLMTMWFFAIITFAHAVALVLFLILHQLALRAWFSRTSCFSTVIKKLRKINENIILLIMIATPLELMCTMALVQGSTIGFIGLFISTLFLNYGLFKVWGKEDVEGPFGGGLLMAGAFNDRKLGRWNWSFDLILVGVGVGSAAVVQSDKTGQIALLVFFLLFMFCMLLALVEEIQLFMSTKPITLKKLDSDGKNNMGNIEDLLVEWKEVQSKDLKVSPDRVTFGRPTTVYTDPESRPASLVFQVFVPQMILIVLYVASLFRDLSNTYWRRGFAILGAFFVPATLVASNIPESVRSMDFHIIYCRLQAEGKLHLIRLKDGKPAPRLSWLYLRGITHCIVNLCFPFMVITTLPMFLALSPSPGEFVLNAMAIIYVIQMDNISASQRAEYVFSDSEETSNLSQTSDLPANGHIESVAEDMQVVVVAEPQQQPQTMATQIPPGAAPGSQS